jgi:class 3 adenylate cyclase
VLISQSTAEELGDKFNLRKLSPVKLRGRSEPVRVFRVAWQAAAKKKRRPIAGAVGS